MVQKILKVITNNFGLKVLAVVIAVIFWLVIVNVEDPEKTKQFMIKVEMQNAEVLEEQGMTYEVVDSSDVIAFTVSGQRSIIERLTVEDFAATANLENLENMSQVPITITAKKYAQNITITKRSQYVEVFVENIESVTVPVVVEPIGEVPEGFLLSDYTPSQDTIRLTGPSSLVESVDRAVAWVDVTALEADSVQKIDLALYDAEDNVVETERISMSNSVVTVSIGVLERTTVPVIYEVNGSPGEGYRITDVTGAIDRVSILGKSNVIGSIESIVIDGADMNVDGAIKTLETVIDLNDYLPDGISLAEGQDAEIIVIITLEGKESREFLMPTANIQVKNIPEGYAVKLEGDTVPVMIRDYVSDLNRIDAAQLKGVADATDITEMTLTLKVTVAGDYQVEEAIVVAVEVWKETGEVPGPETDTETEEVPGAN